MSPDEINDLLKLVVVRDRRTIGPDDFRAWLADVGDLHFHEAAQAVSDHFREEPDKWLMAGHVRLRVKAARQRLIERAGTHAQHHALHGSDDGDERAHRDALRNIIQRIGDNQCPPFKALEGGRRESRPPETAQEIRRQYLADQQAKKLAEREASDARQAAAVAEHQSRQESLLAAGVLLLLTNEAAVAAFAAARDELGPDATRDQITIRAAQLADHAQVKPDEEAPESRSAKRGCRHGCSVLGHEKPCPHADADSPIGRVVEEK